MNAKRVSRRQFVASCAAMATGLVAGACGPKLVQKEVTRIVKELVKETVMVEGTPQVVEKEVTRVVKETVIVEAATPVAAPEEGVTMRYWVGWGSYPRPWEQIQALGEYDQFIGHNTVELKAGISAEVLLTAVAGGDPPDAVSHPSGQYLDYMARGVLLPLEDLVAASTTLKPNDYLEGCWNKGYWKGTLYGVPANEGFLRFGLNYNARLVEAAGLDPDSPPLTWEECLGWHQILTQFDDAGNLLRMGLDPYDAMGGALAFDDGFFVPLSWGWDWFDEEAGTFDLNNEKMAEAFEVMGKFYRIAGPDNMAGMRQVEGQGDWGGSFNTEVQAMIIEGYWHPGETMFEKPEVAQYNRASWAPVPASRSGTRVQGYGGHYILLFKEAAHPGLAFKIAELVNIDAACDLIFQQVGWLPARIPYLEKVDPATYPGLEFYFRSIDEATDWQTPAGCRITGFVQTQYVELREKVFRDEMTGLEAAEEFQKRCEDEWIAAGFA